MRKQPKATDLFAFWRYDLFPYVLGAPVTEMDEIGWIRAKGYNGRWFKPTKLLPLADGKELWKRILKVQEHQRQKLHEFHLGQLHLLEEVAPFVVKNGTLL
jgi:hypothetical protein